MDQTTNFQKPSRTKLAAITATHCCACRRELTDAVSVERGIGPICSTKYYNPDHIPTEMQVMAALGLLHKARTEGLVDDPTVEALCKLKGDARKLSNKLVYWISAHYSERSVVLGVTPIIRALGYTDFADKLEIDRVKARIMPHPTDPTQLALHVITKGRCQSDLKHICEASCDLDKESGKSGWSIPDKPENRRHIMAILGFHFTEGLMVEDGTVRVIPRRGWNDIKACRSAIANQTTVSWDGGPLTGDPQPMKAQVAGGDIEVTLLGEWIRVRTPYNKKFKNALKAAVPYEEWKWEGVWVVRSAHLNRIKNLIEEHFGVTL